MSIADELITRGWCQFDEMDREGRVCLRGAASLAYTGTTDLAFMLPEVVRDTLYSLVEARGYDGIADWNDNVDRTYEEVLRLAKEADEILDNIQSNRTGATP